MVDHMSFNPEPLVPAPTTPKELGDHGERLVSDSISELAAVDGVSCVLIDNVILPVPDAKRSTAQIDHVLVCPSTVLVIETKNWFGHIYGTADSKVWTQTLPGGNKNTFSNPVKQVQRQANILQRHIWDGVQIVPIVAFVGEGELKKDTGSNVATLPVLMEYVDGVAAKPGPLDVAAIAQMIREVSKNLEAGTAASSPAKPAAKKAAPAKTQTHQPTDPQTDSPLFQRLREWRARTAKAEGNPPHYVFADKTLRQLAAKQPRNRDQLLAIHGIGPVKADKYGPEVLAVIEVEQSTGDASTSGSAGPVPPQASEPKHAAKPSILGEATKLAGDMIRNWNK